jgi:starvation-inducible DNA-binding protein
MNRSELTQQQWEATVKILRHTLADEYLLYTKTRNYHWNVTGARFNDLHKFFEGQYEVLDEKIDEIAEFIRYFDQPAPASLAEFLKWARLKEDSSPAQTAEAMVKNLLADHELLIRSLRNDVAAIEESEGPVEVADLLTGLLADHGKMAWMLRSTAA